MVEKQQKIEDLWIQILSDYFKNLNTGDVTYLNKQNAKIKQCLKSFNLMVQQKFIAKKFPKSFEYLSDERLVLLTYLICYESILRKWSLTETSKILAERIIQFIYLTLINENVKGLNKEAIIKFKELKIKTPSLSNISQFTEYLNFTSNLDLIKLGDFFIDIFCNFPCDIFERKVVEYYEEISHAERRLDIKEEIKNEFLDSLVVAPFSLPMACKPLTWSDEAFGGHFSNVSLKNSIITGSNVHGHNMTKKEALYRTVNKLSSIPFRVNEELLNFIESRTDLSAEVLRGNIRDLITFSIAKAYNGVIFYLPVNADWRGRMYVDSHYLSYQANDLSVALIQFNKGASLTEAGLYNLYISGANAYNEKKISKKNMTKRYQWVLNNMQNILAMENAFLAKAENKWSFIAFCLNMRRLARDPQAVIYTPVFLDATCSGIQHLAGLIKDEELGKEVNLIKQDENSEPGDIYSTLLWVINANIQELGSRDESLSNLAKVALNREIVKRPIMTKTYNATVTGMRDSLAEKLVAIKPDSGKTKFWLAPSTDGGQIQINEKELMIIAQIVYNGIYERFPSLKNIYDYFLNMIKVFNTLQIPLSWETPAGVMIVQKYNKSVQKTCSIYLGGKSRKYVLREFTNELDKRKQVSAGIPNIIHSLDASHIMNIVKTNSEMKNFDLLTVHDCFGTHPNNLNELVLLVKLEFIAIYLHKDFLSKFHKDNINNIKAYDCDYIIKKDTAGKEYMVISKSKKVKAIVPNLPDLGNLDLTELVHSKYFLN